MRALSVIRRNPEENELMRLFRSTTTRDDLSDLNAHQQPVSRKIFLKSELDSSRYRPSIFRGGERTQSNTISRFFFNKNIRKRNIPVSSEKRLDNGKRLPR